MKHKKRLKIDAKEPEPKAGKAYIKRFSEVLKFVLTAPARRSDNEGGNR